MQGENKEPTVITYVVYDKNTGRIVHTHRRFDVEKGIYSKCDPQTVKSLTVEDDFAAMSKVTDNQAENLDVIMTTDLPENFSPGISGLLVDLDSKAIVKKPKLTLKAEKMELDGDGEDSTPIEIKVLDDGGAIVENYNGAIKISTSRGKLSTKGGLVEMKNGVGRITLTSVNETVDRVQVTAQCLEDKCSKAGLNLAFV